MQTNPVTRISIFPTQCVATYLLIPIILLLAVFTLDTFWLNLALVRCALRTEQQCLPPDSNQHLTPTRTQRMLSHAGRTVLAHNNAKQAIPWLEQAVSMDASDTSSGFFLGLAYRQNGDETHAIAQWQRIDAAAYFIQLGRTQQTTSNLRTAIAIDPSNAEAHRQLGDLLWIQGGHDQAVAAYHTFLNLDTVGEIQYQLAEARIAEHAEAWTQAISIYEQATQNYPSRIEPCLRLGDLYRYSLGKPDVAITWFQEAIRREPEYLWAYQAISDTYIGAGDFINAAQWASYTVARFPTNAFSYIEQGVVASLQGKHTEAIEAFTRAVAVDPSNFWPYYYRGSERLTLKQAQAAVEDFRQAVQLAPYSAVSIKGLADAYWQAGQIEAAVANYQRLLELIPNEPWATQQINNASK